MTFASPMMAQSTTILQTQPSVTVNVTGSVQLNVTPSVTFSDSTYKVDSDNTRFHYTVTAGEQLDLSDIILAIDADAQIVGASHEYELVNADVKTGIKGLKFKYKAKTVDDKKMDFWVDIKGNWSKELIDSDMVTGSSNLKFKVMGPGVKLMGSESDKWWLNFSKISDVIISGKAKIEFELPEGLDEQDIEIISYKPSENNGKREIHANVRGKYKSGKHTVELAVPDKDYEIEICARDKDNKELARWKKTAVNGWVKVDSDQVISLNKLIVTPTVAEINVNGELSWKVKNPNTSKVTFDWMIDGTEQKGTKTIEAGAEVIVTAKTGGTNTLITTLPGDIRTEAKGDLTLHLMKKLILVPVSAHVNGELRWKVKNPNATKVTFDWIIDGTDQKGTKTIEAGAEVIVTAKTGGTNTLIVTLPGDIKTEVKGDLTLPLLHKLILVPVKAHVNGMITWEIHNPNAESVTVDWIIEGTDQKGQLTLKANEVYPLTTKPEGSNKLIVKVEGVLQSEQVGDEDFKGMEKLILIPLQSNVEGKIMWKVLNPNVIPVDFKWIVLGTDQQGTSTLDAGAEVVVTANPGGFNSLLTTLPGGIQTEVKAAEYTPPTDDVTDGTTAPGSVTGSDTGMPENGMGGPLDPTGSMTPPAQAGSGTSIELTGTSAANLQALPQTGEKIPYTNYAAGSLLALLGALFLRKKKQAE
jgi:LPXTG-motif cell wall-anchored protein